MPRPDENNLYNGIAEIGIGGSLGTIYSEWAVATTGCGPLDMGDSLERGCYLVCLMIAALSVFWRIGFGSSLATSLEDQGLRASTTVQVRAAEWLALAGVAGAVLALTLQLGSGADVWASGLSGIDRFMCEASR